MSTSLISVPFNSDIIFYAVEESGEPFVPMRPICENIGLDWKVQHRKLMANETRWCVVMMTTHDASGRLQEMVCLPQRRLFGWLMSIHPSKVKPELRDKLTAYQQECDEVLFHHFVGSLQERDELITTLDRQNRQMASYLLAFNPLWGKIAHLQAAGTYRGNVWRMLNRPEHQIAEVIGDMERVGAIGRDGWRPSMWGIWDGPAPKPAAQPELPMDRRDGHAQT